MRVHKRKFFLLLLGGLFFCCLGIVSFLIWSPKFLIQEINISFESDPVYCRAEDIDLLVKESLSGEKWFVSKGNVFFAPLSGMQAAIKERFPVVDDVDFDISLPNRLDVYISERESVGIWCEAEKVPMASSTEDIYQRIVGRCYDVDNQGVVFKDSLLAKNSLVLNVFDLTGRRLSLLDQVVSSSTMNFLLTVDDRLAKVKTAREAPFLIDSFDFFSPEDIRANTSLSQIFFDSSASLDVQLPLLSGILDMEESFQYIDLRIEGRGYYKKLLNEENEN